LIGVARAYQSKGKHLITQPTEHKSVLGSMKALNAEGIKTTIVPVSSTGRVDPKEIEKAITSETILVSIMSANNEIGTLQPIEEIGAITKKHGVLFHCDAVQSLGKIPLDVNRYHIDLLAIAGHKMYGPKGVGALYLRKIPRVRISPILHGASQE